MRQRGNNSEKILLQCGLPVNSRLRSSSVHPSQRIHRGGHYPVVHVTHPADEPFHEGSVLSLAQRHSISLYDYIAEWVGLGWVGLGWVGLGWVGLGWVGLGWFERLVKACLSVAQSGLGWLGSISQRYSPPAYGSIAQWVAFARKIIIVSSRTGWVELEDWPVVVRWIG